MGFEFCNDRNLRNPLEYYLQKIQGYSEFILAGHSLGTIKSVRYLFEGEYADTIRSLILLAPFDKMDILKNIPAFTECGAGLPNANSKEGLSSSISGINISDL